jgi:hypothetical protein
MKQVYTKHQVNILINENRKEKNINEGLYGSTKGFFKGVGGALKNSWKHMMESRRIGSDIEDVKEAIEALKGMKSIIGRKINKRALDELEIALNGLYNAYNGQTNDNFNGRAYSDNTNNDSNDNTINSSPIEQPTSAQSQPEQGQTIINGKKIEDEENLENKIEDIYKALTVLGMKGQESTIKKEIFNVLKDNPDMQDQDIIKLFLKKM